MRGGVGWTRKPQPRLWARPNADKTALGFSLAVHFSTRPERWLGLKIAGGPVLYKMADSVLIPLPGVGTLELTREQYNAALHPIAVAAAAQAAASTTVELVTAKALAAQLSLPVSCLYEYAKAGRIPCVRAGKHVRFNADQVLAALRSTGGVTVGHS